METAIRTEMRQWRREVLHLADVTNTGYPIIMQILLFPLRCPSCLFVALVSPRVTGGHDCEIVLNTVQM